MRRWREGGAEEVPCPEMRGKKGRGERGGGGDPGAVASCRGEELLHSERPRLAGRPHRSRWGRPHGGHVVKEVRGPWMQIPSEE